MLLHTVFGISIVLSCLRITYCLTCLSCEQISQPRHCRFVETCKVGEICGSKLQLSVGGYNEYMLGCVAKSSCYNGTGSAFCSECCDSRDLCNAALCGEPDYPTTRGPVCYNCHSFTGNQACRRIDFCSVLEDCFLHGVEEFGDLSLTTGCKPRYDCLATPSVSPFGRRSAKSSHVRSSSHVVCESCCSNDLCNLNCTGSPYCDQSTCVHGFCKSGGALVSTGSLCSCSPGWGGPKCDQVVKLPMDCSELPISMPRNDSYTIYPYGVISRSVDVYCEFNFDGIWTVIQRRFDGSLDFYRTWADYKNGFGNSSAEYWLGNDAIHQLTSHGKYAIKFVLKDWTDEIRFAEYSSFKIAGESDGYRLTISGYKGNAGDAMTQQTTSPNSIANGMKFATHDADSGIHCARNYHGSWWYNMCFGANLNGRYSSGPNIATGEGLVWYHWHGFDYSLKATTLMIRKI